MPGKAPRKRRTPAKKKKDVTVNSKTYGEHTRAPRGSIKEAELNEAMKASSARLELSNAPARLIRNAILPFQANFTGGQFWQRLLQHFRAQGKDGMEYSVKDLERLDVNSNYPLSAILYSKVFVINLDKPALSMEITCNYTLSPRFLERTPYVDSMQLTVIAFFPDFKENDVIVNSVVLPLKKVEDQEPYSFILPVPATASSYLFFWKLEGTKKGVITDKRSNVAKAIYLIKSGML